VDILAAIDRSMPWVDDAACVDSDRNWVLDPVSDRNQAATIYSLLVICAQCPVRKRCLEYALSSDIDCVGVWGGSTTFERRRLLPGRHTPEWHYEDSRRRAITHATETLEAGLPARLKAWRSRALRSNRAQSENSKRPPRYPVGRAPMIA
jgi:WhiB family redox-sensing transcriptional regulator